MIVPVAPPSALPRVELMMSTRPRTPQASSVPRPVGPRKPVAWHSSTKRYVPGNLAVGGKGRDTLAAWKRMQCGQGSSSGGSSGSSSELLPHGGATPNSLPVDDLHDFAQRRHVAIHAEHTIGGNQLREEGVPISRRSRSRSNSTAQRFWMSAVTNAAVFRALALLTAALPLPP
jgi:hypothetical protein